MYFNKIEFKPEGINGYVVDGVKENNSYYIYLSETILRIDMCGDTPNIVWKKYFNSGIPKNFILLQDKLIFDSSESNKSILEAVDNISTEKERNMEKGFVLIPGAGMSDWIWTRLLPPFNEKSSTHTKKN